MGAPLMGMLMLGNFIEGIGVVGDWSMFTNTLTNLVTLSLG